MSTGPVRRSIITTITTAILTVGSVIYVSVILLPSIKQHRQDIDDRRASLVVIEQEQSNLEALSQSIEKIEQQQTELNQHVWSFTVEEEFYDLWELMAAEQAVTIGVPKVAEVTPTNQPLSRAVTVIMTGPVKNIMTSINAIQKLDPVVMIEKITIDTAPNAQVTSTIDAQTLWQ